MGFFEYLSQHKLAAAGLVLLILLTVFAWIMVVISGRKRSAERERVIADLEREKALRKEFKNVDELTFAEGKDDYRLVVGMCANVQQRLEKSENMDNAFSELSQVERYTYALGYVFEDSRNGLSEFFRSNGEPLLSVAAEAVSEIIGGKFNELFSKERIMLDENDETTSVDKEVLEKTDAEFKELLENEGAGIYAEAASYIRKNKDYFLY